MDPLNSKIEYLQQKIDKYCTPVNLRSDDARETIHYEVLSPYDSFTSKFRSTIPSYKTFYINKKKARNYIIILSASFLISGALTIYLPIASLFAVISLILTIGSIREYRVKYDDNTVITVGYDGIRCNDRMFQWIDITTIYLISSIDSDSYGKLTDNDLSIMICLNDLTMHEINLYNFQSSKILDYIKYYRKKSS